MKRGVIIALIILMLGPMWSRAQIGLDQSERLEIPLSWKELPFEVFPWYKQGLVLFREIPDHAFNRRGWELRLHAFDLSTRWNIILEGEPGYDVVGWDIGESSLYLLLEHRNDKTRDYHIKSFSALNGAEKHYEIPNSFPLMLTHFEVTGNRVLFGGSYNMNPVVLLGNLQAGTSATLPGIFRDNSSLIDINKDVINGRFTVLVQERDMQRNYTMAVKNFDESGALLEDIILKIPDHKALLDAKVTNWDGRGQRVVGTYARKRSNFPEGFFVAIIPPSGEPVIQYHPFGELQNFFTFLRQGRIQRHINRHQGDEDKVSRPINYQIIFAELRQGLEEDMLVATMVKADSRSIGNTLWNPMAFRNPMWSTMQPGHQMDSPYFRVGTHVSAVVLGIDAKGQIAWDNIMNLDDMGPTDEVRHIAIASTGRQLQYLYNIENELRYQITEGGRLVLDKQEAKIALPNPEDRERSFRPETFGTLLWYDDVFLAYGVQRIKNLSGEIEDRARKVFYLNKIRIR